MTTAAGSTTTTGAAGGSIAIGDSTTEAVGVRSAIGFCWADGIGGLARVSAGASIGTAGSAATGAVGGALALGGSATEFPGGGATENAPLPVDCTGMREVRPLAVGNAALPNPAASPCKPLRGGSPGGSDVARYGRTVYRSLASRSLTRTTPSFSNSQRNLRIETPPRALLRAPAQESDSTVTVAAVPPDGAGSSTTHRIMELAFRTGVCGK